MTKFPASKRKHTGNSSIEQQGQSQGGFFIGAHMVSQGIGMIRVVLGYDRSGRLKRSAGHTLVVTQQVG